MMMQWHIVCRVGEGDNHVPSIGSDEPRLVVPIDQPGQLGQVAARVLFPFREATGLSISPTTADLLNLAIAVYAADLRVRRIFAADRWSRCFTLHLPVIDVARWKHASKGIVEALNFLTGDDWTLVLRPATYDPNPPVRVKKGPLVEKPDLVSLFSGGLDSFVGAIDRLYEGKKVALVGHHGKGITHAVQKPLVDLLTGCYAVAVSSFHFYVQPPKIADDPGEPTMRSRSILFLALGTAVAAAFGKDVPLQVAENGFISLNAPSTYTRLGSFSTRTTHPHFIALYRKVLSSLKIPTPIELPYRFLTKGEMLLGAPDQAILRQGTPLTMSCAHPEAGRHHKVAPNTPCGYCVPCLIRRAATAAAGVPDRTHWVDVHSAPPSANGRTGRDLRAFQMAVERAAKSTPSELRARVLDNGPLPAAEFSQYFQTYLRGIDEVRQFLVGTTQKR